MSQGYHSEHQNVTFIPGNDVEAAIKNYIDVSSDGNLKDLYESLPEKRRAKEIQLNIVRSLENDFAYFKAEYGRFTKSHVYTSRPIGLKNLILKPEGEAPADASPFVLKNNGESASILESLPSWFSAERDIRSVLGHNRRWLLV